MRWKSAGIYPANDHEEMGNYHNGTGQHLDERSSPPSQLVCKQVLAEACPSATACCSSLLALMGRL